MKLRNFFTVLTVLVAANLGVAQSDSSNVSDKMSVGLSLNHDAFFGFNPMMTAAYSLSEKGAITAYGIQWGAGTASAWAQWTEFGFGYNLTAGSFDINPQIGFTFGSLLSSGAAQPGVVGDGFVPNLTINHGSDKLEGQIYVGYYGALRDETAAGEATNNYVHYWANVGHKASSVFSWGGHFEQLYLSGGSVNGGADLDRVDGYMWVGPYVQIQNSRGGFRFAAGMDVEDSGAFGSGDFYKMNFFLNI